MEQDLFNPIKNSEYEMLDYSRMNYINLNGEYSHIKHILNQ